jgi:hypothetical protein
VQVSEAEYPVAALADAAVGEVEAGVAYIALGPHIGGAENRWAGRHDSVSPARAAPAAWAWRVHSDYPLGTMQDRPPTVLRTEDSSARWTVATVYGVEGGAALIATAANT